MLLGAPTGSGKTVAAEVAMLRVFDKYPGSKVIEELDDLWVSVIEGTVVVVSMHTHTHTCTHTRTAYPLFHLFSLSVSTLLLSKLSCERE